MEEHNQSLNSHERCPICIDNEINVYTHCKHGYCINCLVRITKCAMCRRDLNYVNTNNTNININAPGTINGVINEGIHVYSFSANLSIEEQLAMQRHIDNYSLRINFRRSRNVNNFIS